MHGIELPRKSVADFLHYKAEDSCIHTICVYHLLTGTRMTGYTAGGIQFLCTPPPGFLTSQLIKFMGPRNTKRWMQSESKRERPGEAVIDTPSHASHADPAQTFHLELHSLFGVFTRLPTTISKQCSNCHRQMVVVALLFCAHCAVLGGYTWWRDRRPLR